MWTHVSIQTKYTSKALPFHVSHQWPTERVQYTHNQNQQPLSYTIQKYNVMGCSNGSMNGYFVHCCTFNVLSYRWFINVYHLRSLTSFVHCGSTSNKNLRFLPGLFYNSRVNFERNDWTESIIIFIHCYSFDVVQLTANVRRLSFDDESITESIIICTLTVAFKQSALNRLFSLFFISACRSKNNAKKWPLVRHIKKWHLTKRLNKTQSASTVKFFCSCQK